MRYRVSYLMGEIWERAVETALDGQTDHASVRNLTLDGAVKCVQGRLPPPSILQRFPNLQHLSLANIGLSYLEIFPRLENLQKLVLSDNRIAGGLECLVEAGLRSLVDLDLSNNRIQYIEDLAPLAEFRLVSLDLYECPVTRVKDYRAKVFGLIKSLKYLDKMDAEENETPESDDEEEDDEEEEDDPGSGEVDGGERPLRSENGHSRMAAQGILDVDEDEESDADEEENEILRHGQPSHHGSNGYRMVRAEEMGDDVDDDEVDEMGDDVDDDEVEEDNSSGEEIDEEDGEEDEVVEVHEVADSDNEDDVVEYDEEDDDEDEDDDDDEEEEEEEEVDNEERGMALPSSTGRRASTEGEIDGHEQGEEDADEDDNGETGEEDEQGVEEGGYEVEVDAEEEDEDDDEENGSGYLVQPVIQPSAVADDDDDELSGGSDMEPVNDEEDEEEEEDLDGEEDVEDDHQVGQGQMPPSSSSHYKRKRSDEDDDENSGDSDEEDDIVRQDKLPKKSP